MCLAPEIKTSPPPPPPGEPAETAAATESGLDIRDKKRKKAGTAPPSLTIPRNSLNIPG